MFKSLDQPKQEVFHYIEIFYNAKRWHTYHDRISPVEFEKQYYKNGKVARKTMLYQRADPKTRLYTTKRSAEGKSIKEIQRCIKLYIVRELYPTMMSEHSVLR